MEFCFYVFDTIMKKFVLGVFLIFYTVGCLNAEEIDEVLKDEEVKTYENPGNCKKKTCFKNKLVMNLTGLNVEKLSHEPWSEFEKLYVKKGFPKGPESSNYDEVNKEDTNEIQQERKKRNLFEKVLFSSQNNKHKMDENIKEIGEFPENSKFLGINFKDEKDLLKR